MNHNKQGAAVDIQSLWVKAVTEIVRSILKTKVSRTPLVIGSICLLVAFYFLRESWIFYVAFVVSASLIVVPIAVAVFRSQGHSSLAAHRARQAASAAVALSLFGMIGFGAPEDPRFWHETKPIAGNLLNMLFVWIAPVSAIAGICVAWLVSRPQFKDREAISREWDRLISSSDASIVIVAGDCSWLPEHRESLAKAAQRSIDVSVFVPERVVPRLLESHAISEAIGGAIRSGVRFLRSGSSPESRFILVDRDDSETAACLEIEKRTLNGERAGGLVRRAQRFDGSRDWPRIKIQKDLISALEKSSSEILGVSKRDISKEKIADALRKVEMYSSIVAADFEYEMVEIDKIVSCCRYFQSSKLHFMRRIVEAFLDRSWQLFAHPIEILNPLGSEQDHYRGRREILLPPIVEKTVLSAPGGGRPRTRFVIVDGIHRVAYAYHTLRKTKISAIVISDKAVRSGFPDSDVLYPGELLDFSSMLPVKTKPSRNENFSSWNQGAFREIDHVYNYLND